MPEYSQEQVKQVVALRGDHTTLDGDNFILARRNIGKAAAA
ncbi:MAG: hypothetical protein ACE5I7_14315 [Candidatus Binatia bacterium]